MQSRTARMSRSTSEAGLAWASVVDARGVSAAAPRWATIAEIEAFIREKERWVQKRLDEVRREAREPFLWQEGARLPYLGRDVSVARTVWACVRLAAGHPK